MTHAKAFVPILLAALVAATTLAGKCAGQAADDKKKVSDEEIAKLIGQLDSQVFKVRAQASDRLKDLAEALPALQKASKSGDVETKRRIQAIIAVLEDRHAEEFIKHATDEVNREGIDLFIDRMVLQKDYATDARWKAAMGLARALAKRAEKVGATPPDLLGQNVLALPVANSLNAGFAGNTRGLVTGSKKILNAFHGCVVFSSGPFEGINSTDRSILFINGDIKNLNSTTNSIIICNGTIKSFNYTKNSLIFCNGVIESMNCTEGNAIFVRGELRQLNHTTNNVFEASQLGAAGSFPGGNTYLNMKALPRAANGDQLKTAEPSVLRIFQFYHPERTGLTFAMVDGDARVETVAEDKLFAKAGLQKGDLILAVNRTKFLGEEDFLRLLRQRVVAGDAQLKVQRGDRVLGIAVKFAP